VTAVRDVVSHSPDELDIAIVAHGGVGALLLAYLQNMPISRDFDQPGQGYFFVFDRDTWKLHDSWKAIDVF
jgi:broad specificity phosphatase PhoE